LGLLDWEGAGFGLPYNMPERCHDCGAEHDMSDHKRHKCEGCGVTVTDDLFVVRGMTLCRGCAKTEMGEQFESFERAAARVYTSRLMVEPHLVSLHRWYHEVWWIIRGVGAADFRALCSRCGRTGQSHWSWKGCWRFKR